MAVSTPGSLSLGSSLNLTTAGNTVVFPLQNSKRLAITINGLTGSGATLAIDGSRDGGATWATAGMSVTDYDLGTSLAALVDDSDYKLVAHGYTHVQIRVATAGTGAASVLVVSLARGLDTVLAGALPAGGSIPTGIALDGTDASGVTAPSGGGGIRGWLSGIFWGIGTPTDTPWSTGAGTLVALGKAIVGKLAGVLTVTLNGMLPGGTNALGTVGVTALPALPAGANTIGALAPAENHVGEVGGNVAKFQSQFGAAATYVAGQVMTAPIEITGMGRVANGTGLITSASLVLNVANTAQVDLVFFSTNPAGAYAAGSTFAVTSADQAKVSKTLHLTDWTALGASASLGEPSPAPKFYRCDDSAKTQSLWVVPVARGSITLAAATDATLTIRASRN